MNILNMKLEDFYDVMEDADNVKKVNEVVRKSQQNSGAGNYEWARFMCLLYGKKNNDIKYSEITEKYLSEFYASPGAVQHALSTAIEGKTGNKSGSYTKDDFMKFQVDKFANGAYQNTQTVIDLLNAIEIEIKNKTTGGPNSLNFITKIKTYVGGLVINSSGRGKDEQSVIKFIEACAEKLGVNYAR